MSDKKEKKTATYKELWQNANPKVKRKITVAVVVTIFVFISILGYYATRHGNKEQVKSKSVQEKAIDIQLQPGLLQATINNKVSQQLKQMQNQVANLQKQLKTLREQKVQQEKPISQLSSNQPSTPNNNSTVSENQVGTPPPPVPIPQNLNGSGQGVNNTNGKAIKGEAEIIGSIGVAKNSEASEISNTNSNVKKKKKEQEVYLPTCFMEASLLSGLDAPTMNGAKGNPVPVLLRVRAPAILPNRVKANLKGCFIIAEGYGDLASERVYLRLVNLSCIAKNGQAVIDQPVKGFVVGSDGKIGLRGRVVSKMGAVLARAALAGFLQGFGNAINSSSLTTWTSSVGTSSTLNASDVGKAALGGGISTASKKLADFYMKLADQTLPVIEVGATRRVTVVISQGTMLKLRNVCIGGEKCDQ